MFTNTPIIRDPAHRTPELDEPSVASGENGTP